MGVSTAPGPTPTTRMLCGASSTPAVRVNMRTPPFERQYAALPGIGQSSCTDVMLMMRPPVPWAIMRFAASWVPKNALFKIDVEHLLVLRLGRVEHRRARLDPGVVHHDVEAAELLHRGVDEALQVLDLAHVGVDADGLAAQRDDLLFELLRRVLVADVVDDDVRAVLGEGEHDRLADPGVASGDDGDLAFEQRHGFLSGAGAWPTHRSHGGLRTVITRGDDARRPGAAQTLVRSASRPSGERSR